MFKIISWIYLSRLEAEPSNVLVTPTPSFLKETIGDTKNQFNSKKIILNLIFVIRKMAGYPIYYTVIGLATMASLYAVKNFFKVT